ncbi:MAG: hypothetical protein Q4A25_02605 [Candidatus Saccharibacteria bacterium]|nr:hypothetical protein [Candidatus Saccharibacteria bacterium]
MKSASPKTGAVLQPGHFRFFKPVAILPIRVKPIELSSELVVYN